MRKALFFALLAMLCLQFASAQTPSAPTRYTAYGYHKVLPGKHDLMKQTNEASNLTRSEIRVIIDRLDW